MRWFFRDIIDKARGAMVLALPAFISAAVILSLFLYGGNSSAEPSVSEEIIGEISLLLSDGQSGSALLDRNRDTFLKVPAGNAVTARSERKYSYIYILWDSPPGEWILEYGDGMSVTMGEQGFMHELVRLTAPLDDARIVLEKDAAICDIYFFEEGVLPRWVQHWEPMLDACELLLLPTHADDEHLFFGGIMPVYAGERGMDVQVVYMTNHWADRVRPHELLDGLWTVGVTAYPLIGPFPDIYASKESLASAEQVFDRQKVLEFQVEMLRRFKPEVVVGHDLNGEYGHGAHILNARTLLEALELSGESGSFPESAEAFGIWQVQKAYLHLYAENSVLYDWNTPLERFDGRTAFEMAVEGFSKHVSQQQYFAVTQGGTWQDCRKFGLAYTNVGFDTLGEDLFENVVFPPEPTPSPEVTMPPETVSPAAADPSPVLYMDESAGDADGASRDAAKELYIIVALILLLVILIISAIIRSRGRKAARKNSR